jgi:two-component system sensor histidine kinase CiaH
VTHDDALVRRVRWRLLAWSGGTTLVVLLVLGTVLYTVAAASLRAAGEDQLRARASDMRAGIAFGAGVPIGTVNSAVVDVGSAPGIVIGGPTSGTIAVVLAPASGIITGNPTTTIGSVAMPEGTGLALARSGVETIETSDFNGTPIRILSTPVDRPEGTFVIQVVGDRTAEVRTLTILLAVLLIGGLAVLCASLAVGWVYADRALVPIREAMRRQREFAADASHELRTPLAVVRGSIEDLRRNEDRPVAEVGYALDDMETEVDRMRALVDDLLLLARTDSGVVELALEPTDLGAIALDAADGLQPAAARAGVRLEVDVVPVPTTGDPARLRQLVTILVDNAIRHAPPGSTIEVGVGPSAAAGASATSGRVRVTDAGPGFRTEDLPHVFDRFWRASDAPSGGTGLGLSIAAWIVERHGGTITARNGPDAGAVLEVVLPIR